MQESGSQLLNLVVLKDSKSFPDMRKSSLSLFLCYEAKPFTEFIFIYINTCVYSSIVV